MTYPPDPRNAPGAWIVVDKFKAEGYDPEGRTLYTYAAIQAFAQAAEKAKSVDVDDLSKALHSITAHTVVSPLTWDKKGDITGSKYVFTRGRTAPTPKCSGQMERSLALRVWAVAVLLMLCAGFVSAASAEVTQIVDGVPFLIGFHGTVRGLTPGAPVEIQGIRIGEVTSVGVDYAPDGNTFVASVGIVLQPSLFPAAGVHPRTATEVYDAADVLVRRGLRAEISDTQLLGGNAIVTLDIQPGAAPATLDRSGKVPELPAGATQQERIAQQVQPLIAKLANAPIDQMFAELQDSMAALKRLVTGPELGQTLEELRSAAADLRNVVDRLGGRSDALIANLNETVRSTNRLIDHTGQTLATIDRQVGDRSPLLADIRGLVQQMDGAARSLRLMAEYLERNPNALITGKSDNRR